MSEPLQQQQQVGEDAKKRESSDSSDHPDAAAEGSKKSRISLHATAADTSAAAADSQLEDVKKTPNVHSQDESSNNKAFTSLAKKQNTVNDNRPPDIPCFTFMDDIEAALQCLTRPEVREEIFNSSKGDDNSRIRIQFRIGNAGDASRLASLYRRQQEQLSSNPAVSSPVSKTSNTGNDPFHYRKNSSSHSLSEYTSLEVRLAEALGDEDTPPFVYALMALEIPNTPSVTAAAASGSNDSQQSASTASPPHGNEDDTLVRAAALCYIEGLEDDRRVLHVAWMHVDVAWEGAALLEQHVRMRLTALSYMKRCTQLVFDVSHNNSNSCNHDQHS
jgi:hypothetical protein